jgi:hypothetical protein
MRQGLESLLLSDDELEAAKQAVRELAYDKWQRAGCPEDSALHVWLEAEFEWIEYCYVPDRYPAGATH